VRLADVTSSRELLWNLTLRELRGKYKRSVLGWAWSLLNPLSTMVIYTIVFGVILDGSPPVAMPNGEKVFALYLLCGLLPWNFLAQTTGTAMGSMVANGGLVKKVWFPREVLVFATAASLLFSFLIEAALLVVALLAFGTMALPWVPVALGLTVLLACFATGLGLMLAAGNVYFRDLGYLWSIFTQLWFFATPIVYPITLVAKELTGSWAWVLSVYRANPMALFVEAYRRCLYEARWPTVGQVGGLLVISLVTLALGLWVFARLSPRFAEEI
jgi:lipopolysaccharide transport system permease protein